MTYKRPLFILFFFLALGTSSLFGIDRSSMFGSSIVSTNGEVNYSDNWVISTGTTYTDEVYNVIGDIIIDTSETVSFVNVTLNYTGSLIINRGAHSFVNSLINSSTEPTIKVYSDNNYFFNNTIIGFNVDGIVIQNANFNSFINNTISHTSEGNKDNHGFEIINSNNNLFLNNSVTLMPNEFYVITINTDVVGSDIGDWIDIDTNDITYYQWSNPSVSGYDPTIYETKFNLKIDRIDAKYLDIFAMSDYGNKWGHRFLADFNKEYGKPTIEYWESGKKISDPNTYYGFHNKPEDPKGYSGRSILFRVWDIGMLKSLEFSVNGEIKDSILYDYGSADEYFGYSIGKLLAGSGFYELWVTDVSGNTAYLHQEFFSINSDQSNDKETSSSIKASVSPIVGIWILVLSKLYSKKIKN